MEEMQLFMQLFMNLPNNVTTTTIKPAITDSNYGWIPVVVSHRVYRFLFTRLWSSVLAYDPEMTPNSARSLVSSSSNNSKLDARFYNDQRICQILKKP